MKIAVLVKEVPDTAGARKLDPVTGILDRAASESVPDEINERSLEHALCYREAGNDVEITLVAVVPSGADGSVRKLLAMGADDAVLVSDESVSGADAVRTAGIIAAALSKIAPDLVVAGSDSTDGRSGLVPSMIAEYLGWPVLPGLTTVQIDGTAVTGDVGVAGEQLQLRAELPAVISTTEISAEPRFPNFKGIMKAKKKPMETWTLADLGDVPQHPASSVMVSAIERPARVAGPKVEDDGTGAKQLAEFLTANKLI
ncbi:MAG: electron transfer flavoprotein subunit beta/FixA family protein [Gulosibacter sp.]|uniref:electron transfer flavoprotein subunit beta/FixA family protein n=1 Tax=Gulosibacter sp. TaxID=2817531 RepID=UPI003F918E0B